jgi:hypothetical protein
VLLSALAVSLFWVEIYCMTEKKITIWRGQYWRKAACDYAFQALVSSPVQGVPGLLTVK